jgi:Nup53/35/40-type RNA recognition motif
MINSHVYDRQAPTPSTMTSFGQNSFASSNNEYPPTSYSESDQATINVCGFPPSMTSYILDHFRQYGEIYDYRNSGSNWMTITYSTRLSAQKALSRNGKIIGGNCMIGVSPANQQNVFGAVTSPELSKDDKAASKPLVGRPIQVDRTGQIWRSSGLGSGRAGPSATMANGQNHNASNVVGGVLAHAKDALFAW